jgi:glycine oxidase
VVIGGGVIGLSIARQLAMEGWSITILEKSEPGKEATSAAGGMLAPRLEFPSGSPLLELGLASKALYPDYVREIEEESGLAVDLRFNGILRPLGTEEESAETPEGAAKIEHHELHELEVCLSPAFHQAFYYPREGSVDNRALASALLLSSKRRGVEVVSRTEVSEVLVSSGRVCGVMTPEKSFGADIVINCAGAWAGNVHVPFTQTKVKPIKGQMLLLDRGRSSKQGPRLAVYSHSAYVVPRSDGRVIVGTTVEDRGFDKVVEAGAVSKLIEGALRLCPSLSTARFVEAWAGLRPLGEGSLPRVGPEGPEGYFVAVGHYRNGILLAPWTARRLVDQIQGRRASCAQGA